MTTEPTPALQRFYEFFLADLNNERAEAARILKEIVTEDGLSATLFDGYLDSD
jgi:hypothetical protein